MDSNRTIAELDVHKDTIDLCIMQHDGAIIFQKTYGTVTHLSKRKSRLAVPKHDEPG